jgi:carboxylesterase type B
LKAQDEFTAQVSTDFSGAKFYLPFTPNIDGTVITRQPVASLTDAKLSKPLLLGTNKDEAVLLVGSKSISPSAYAAWTASLFGDAFEKVIAKYPVNENSSNSSVWARLQTDNFLLCSSRYVASVYKAPVYVYLFNHHPMFNFLGSACGADKNVCHSAELPFVFHTVDKLGGSFSREEEQLSLKIIDYWTNFAINLEPGKSDKQDTLVWPAFVNNNKKYMNLDTPSVTITHDPYQTICEFWNAIGYDRVVPWHN